MIDVEKIKAHVGEIMHRFPSLRATVQRPTVDAYEQPTGAYETLGEVEMWWRTPDTGTGIRLHDRGQTFDEDGVRWATLLDDGLPEVKRGDRVTVGGETYVIGNTQTLIARVFWQLRRV